MRTDLSTSSNWNGPQSLAPHCGISRNMKRHIMSSRIPCKALTKETQPAAATQYYIEQEKDTRKYKKYKCTFCKHQVPIDDEVVYRHYTHLGICPKIKTAKPDLAAKVMEKLKKGQYNESDDNSNLEGGEKDVGVQ